MERNIANENQEEDAISLQIQDILSNINDVTIKIKRELDIINQLTSKDGKLESALKEAKVSLTKKAEGEEINILDILKNAEKEHSGIDESDFVSSEKMTQKILASMEKDKS